MTSPVQSAGARAQPGATSTSLSRCVHRERCCRGRARESLARQQAVPPLLERRLRSRPLEPAAGVRPACPERSPAACRRPSPRVALQESPKAPSKAGASLARRWPGPAAVARGLASIANGAPNWRRRQCLLCATSPTACRRAGWPRRATRGEPRPENGGWPRPIRRGRGTGQGPPRCRATSPAQPRRSIRGRHSSSPTSPRSSG